jgi:hypothetical protein
MKKFSSIVVFLALTSVLSSAQESFAYGIRVGFGYTMFKVNHHLFKVVEAKNPGDPVDPGLGGSFSLGAAFNIPIISNLSFNPELNLGYRSLWWYDNRLEARDCPITNNMPLDRMPAVAQNAITSLIDSGAVGCLFQYLEYEFVISIPLMLKYIPVEKVPFYIAAGIQFDFTPWAEEMRYGYGKPVGFELPDREVFEIGIPISLGYHIAKNFTADFRFVTGLSSAFSTKGDNRSINQFGVGFIYYL